MIRYAMHARDYTDHHMQQSLHAHATTHTTTSPLSFPLVSSLVCFAFVRAHCVQAASRFIGMEGLLVTDDRDGLPFGVQFVPGETRAGAFYSLEELLPVGAAEGGFPAAARGAAGALLDRTDRSSSSLRVLRSGESWRGGCISAACSRGSRACRPPRSAPRARSLLCCARDGLPLLVCTPPASLACLRSARPSSAGRTARLRSATSGAAHGVVSSRTLEATCEGQRVGYGRGSQESSRRQRS